MRKSFSKFQQMEILENQDFKCRSCKTRFSKNVHPQFDHIDGDHTNNSIANGQAICSNCHDAKSRKENVQRSIKQKDIDFVKHCPLCGEKFKGKDYGDENGNRLTTKHLSANDFITCRKCESVFKVIRHDAKAGKQTIRGKKVDGAVKYCTHCGIEFAEKVKSNAGIKCEECKKIWGVWIKTYKKRSFWS